MFSTIWNWLFTDRTETRAHNLLLTKAIRQRYRKQRQAIIHIQRWFRRYSLERNNEENMFLTVTRLKIKNGQTC